MSRLLALACLMLPAPALAVDRVVNVTDCSGAVTAAGISQVATPARANRDLLFVQNPTDATEPLFVNYGASASTTAKNSIELAAGGSINFNGAGVPISYISVTAATTGHKFICKSGGLNQ